MGKKVIRTVCETSIIYLYMDDIGDMQEGFARVEGKHSAAYCQSYLRRHFNDQTIVVRSVECKRLTASMELEDFIKNADISEKTINERSQNND